MVTTGSKVPTGSRGRRNGRPRPAPALAERWTTVDGIDVFYRESRNPPDAPVMMHVHGFGLSGRYLLPTAERLADDFHTLVPDLPGFGRSGKAANALDVPDLAHAAARFLDDRGIEQVTLVGNSMGCPVITEFALPLPRPHRPGGPRVTGGRHLQSAAPPCHGADQSRRTARAGATHARRDPRLRAVRRPEHGADVPVAHAVSVARAPARDEHPDPRGARRPRSADAGSRARAGGGEPDRQPRADREDRGRGARHQLQPPRASWPTSSGCSWRTSRSSTTPTRRATRASTRSTGACIIRPRRRRDHGSGRDGGTEWCRWWGSNPHALSGKAF